MVSTLNDRPYAPSNAGLSFFWPGLAQVCQRRWGAAAFFSIETAAACVLFGAVPESRVLAAIGVAVLTVWSIADAWRAERATRPPAP